MYSSIVNCISSLNTDDGADDYNLNEQFAKRAIEPTAANLGLIYQSAAAAAQITLPTHTLLMPISQFCST